MSAPTPSEAVRVAVQALEAARRFIRNGIEFGRIQMPDPDMPDSAHYTLPTIEDALAALSLHVGDVLDVQSDALDASASPTALSAPALRASAPIAGAEPELVAELHAEIARLKIRGEAYENAYRIAYQATFQSHTGHWDAKGTHGANCPECIRAREARENCDAALREGLEKLAKRIAQAIVTREGQDPQGLGGEAIERGPAGMRPEQSRARPSPHIEPAGWKLVPLEPTPEMVKALRFWPATPPNVDQFGTVYVRTVDEDAANITRWRAALAASPTTPTEGPAQPEVRLNDDGSLDEVVGTGAFHLEQMADDHWWMRLECGDRSIDVWLHARGKIKANFEGYPARATDRYPKGGDRDGLRGEAIEPGPKDAPESDSSKSASTLTDPEGAS